MVPKLLKCLFILDDGAPDWISSIKSNFRNWVGASTVGSKDERCWICFSVDQWTYLRWLSFRKERDTFFWTFKISLDLKAISLFQRYPNQILKVFPKPKVLHWPQSPAEAGIWLVLDRDRLKNPSHKLLSSYLDLLTMGSDWSCHSGTPLISCLRDHFKSESNSAHEREWRPQHCGGSARQRGAGPGPGEAGGGGLHPAGSEQVTVLEVNRPTSYCIC